MCACTHTCLNYHLFLHHYGFIFQVIIQNNVTYFTAYIKFLVFLMIPLSKNNFFKYIYLESSVTQGGDSDIFSLLVRFLKDRNSWAGPGLSQDPNKAFLHISLLSTGCQDCGPPYTSFPGRLAEGWGRNRATRT